MDDIDTTPLPRPNELAAIIAQRGMHAPIMGAFGKLENEQAAALLVRYIAAQGDEWRAVNWIPFTDWLRHLNLSDPTWRDLANPWFSPSFAGLNDTGYVVRDADGYTFTPAAIRKMASALGWEPSAKG